MDYQVHLVFSGIKKIPSVAFVIYGAGSDICAPVFSYFTEAEFICLVNRSKPKHLKGEVIDTGLKDFEATLKTAIDGVSKDRMIVFLNAAVYQKDELFISHSQEDVDQMVRVGITQALYVSQIVMQAMVKRRKGRVINLSSFRANAPAKGAAIYAGIKSFGNAFFKALGLEYGRFDITSNSIAIGFADSKLLDRLEKKKLEDFKKSVAKNEFLPSQEFIQAINYIIDSKYFNSSIIDLNGGLGLLG